jgi:NAD(P)H-flavin reductase
VHRVVKRIVETDDVATLLLEPLTGERLDFRSGQFNMLSAFGVGEVAISVSGVPGEQSPLRHTVRDVGAVSHALWRCDVGDLVGVRGPFGSDWQVAKDPLGVVPDDRDTVVVAGGIGLAPLRGAIFELLEACRSGAGRVFVLVGARDPSQIVFSEDLESWSRDGVHVMTSVDHASPDWQGRVSLVTTLLGDAGFDPSNCRALLCGPEIMMRFTARSLVDMGVDPESILVSLERNMQCGLGWCGHCQLGPLLLCRDGPVVAYSGIVSQLLVERER